LKREKHTCVVVAGYDAASKVWNSWLSDGNIDELLKVTLFYDRRNFSLLTEKE
jgi:hypothetical protein